MNVLLNCCIPSEMCPQLPITQPLHSHYTVFLIWKAGSPRLAAMTTTQKEYWGFLQTGTGFNPKNIRVKHHSLR